VTTAIEVRDLPEQRLLVKKTRCDQTGIARAFGRAIGVVAGCIVSSGAKMASMPYGVYLEWGATDCELAAGFQVRGDVRLEGGVEWLTLAGGMHAFASHFGPYDQLKETHGAILEWCRTQGKKIIGPCWETYPVDPGAEPDPAKWQTDVFYRVG